MQASIPLYLATAFTLIVSLGLPLAAAVFIFLRRKPLLKPFLLGVVTFFVFQIMLRLPLLQNISYTISYKLLAFKQPLLISVLLGLSAAVFEEGGRWFIMNRFMKNNHTLADGLAHGLGHGGFEAFSLVGLSYISMLFTQPSLLLQAGAGSIALAGLERLLTLVIQMGLSAMVLRSLRDSQKRWLVLALVLHTLLDAPLGIAQQWRVPALAIEAYVALFAAGMFAYMLYEYRRQKLAPAAKSDEPQPDTEGGFNI